MNILQITYFLTVAELHSFQKAADALYVSQPAVSIQISRLEKEWGFSVFNRKYKEVTLTPAGENMYCMLIQAAKDYKTSLARSQSMPNGDITTIYIGIPEYFEALNLSEILNEYRKKHPDVEVAVDANTPSLNTFTHGFANRYDLVINMKYLLQEDVDLEMRPFSYGKFTFYISESHSLCADGATPSLVDFSGERIYVCAGKTPGVSSELCRSICAANGITPGDIMELQNISSVLVATDVHNGIMLLDSCNNINLKDHKLKSVETNIETEWYLAWRKGIEQMRPQVIDIAETIDRHIRKSIG